MNPKERMTSAEILEYIESEQNSNSAISSANFKKAPIDPLPRLFARNNTPLHIKVRRINAKAFGNLNLRYRNRLFNNNNL
ncbi:hypothetical protein TVAG_094970 [Trichomonas vaginalis G3]|uniref:Uncharacterized protein n=1 Tax=Trichomonas vaginalis (strain ATCC PRA-98 / G3) TaxID=412133 RepID=A2FZE0_TRIV3|nr:protein serine/threonine kinase protein [Trichomonas vaginalis G3]EAX89732.1 hypothetical protein TVAG_094970 [Trichomonas vaginalis G3]KAI5510784.1 protein serine/threonine kinase protein [Trichomonas vaginalis G3]|eukprot:XP_001302662.1 hypothetical protein [Trichomonas vaginalis G3]